MAKVLTDNQNYANIANNIRSITGSEELLRPAEMPPELETVGQEVNETQATLINQIKTLLESKGVEGVSISVSSGGLITVTYNDDDSATKQLSVQSAKTVTPSTSEQVAVNSGLYTTGVVKVAGDSDLVAGNIKSGVAIFGVTGTYGATYDGTVS